MFLRFKQQLVGILQMEQHDERINTALSGEQNYFFLLSSHLLPQPVSPSRTGSGKSGGKNPCSYLDSEQVLSYVKLTPMYGSQWESLVPVHSLQKAMFFITSRTRLCISTTSHMTTGSGTASDARCI